MLKKCFHLWICGCVVERGHTNETIITLSNPNPNPLCQIVRYKELFRKNFGVLSDIRHLCTTKFFIFCFTNHGLNVSDTDYFISSWHDLMILFSQSATVLNGPRPFIFSLCSCLFSPFTSITQTSGSFQRQCVSE